MLQIECGGTLARVHVSGSAVCIPAPSCFLIRIILSIAQVGALWYVQEPSPHLSATKGEVLLCGTCSHVPDVDLMSKSDSEPGGWMLWLRCLCCIVGIASQ